MGTVALLKGWPACYRRAYLPLYALPLPPCFCTIPKKGPYFEDFFDLFGPYWVPIYTSGSLFSVFWLKSWKECQFSLHVHNNE